MGYPELQRDPEAPMDIRPEAGVASKGAVDFNTPNNYMSTTL